MARARRISFVVASVLVVAGCGDSKKTKEKEPAPTPSADAGGGSGSAPNAPAAGGTSSLPAGRDAEAARLVKAGAACEVKDESISLSCKEREAAGQYAFQHQQSVEVAATCVELMRDPNLAVKLTAAHCLDSVTSGAATEVLGAALDVLEAEPSAKVRQQIAWGLKGAEAVTAKLEDRVLAIVAKLAARPEDETAAGSVLDTLFPQYLMGDAPKPPLRAQQLVLDAFAHPGGGMFFRATDLVRLVEDKAAACKAVAGAIVVDGVDWWRALGAFNDLGAPCAEHAPAVAAVIIAMYAKGKVDDPKQVGRFARLFELTPVLRKRAAAAVRSAKKTAPEWQREAVADAAKELATPWAPPAK